MTDRAPGAGGKAGGKAGAKAGEKAGPASRRDAKDGPADRDAPAARKKPTRDPAGGLTAAGRAEFERRDGAHLKPGVRKPDAELTPDEMRRKGSWATRFYGREALPPLQDPKGRPTRFALSAHAWGEDVPATEADARRIAEKGRELLRRYREAKARPQKT